MVCFFHLVLGNPGLLPSENILERVCSYGYLGVEVFFILSGYVICYSLPANFGYHHLKTFFLKRVTRIEPPYIASILLVLILNFFSYRITGAGRVTIDLLTLLGHLAYVNNFIPNTYVNVVYWTLGIEFQFYFFIAFVFPIMKTEKAYLYIILALFLLLACFPIAGGFSIFFPYFLTSALGLLCFFTRSGEV